MGKWDCLLSFFSSVYFMIFIFPLISFTFSFFLLFFLLIFLSLIQTSLFSFSLSLPIFSFSLSLCFTKMYRHTTAFYCRIAIQICSYFVTVEKCSLHTISFIWSNRQCIFVYTWQCIFTFFSCLETSGFDLCYEPTGADSALPCHLLVCSFYSVPPSLVQGSIVG